MHSLRCIFFFTVYRSTFKPKRRGTNEQETYTNGREETEILLSVRYRVVLSVDVCDWYFEFIQINNQSTQATQ